MRLAQQEGKVVWTECKRLETSYAKDFCGIPSERINVVWFLLDPPAQLY